MDEKPDSESPTPDLTPVLEPAPSGRAKCRGCGSAIAKQALRFGEPYENPYNDGIGTLWFHPTCAAYKRPEPFLAAVEAHPDLPDAEGLREIAERGLAHRRLARLDTIERAASGRATCRHCRTPIDKNALRIKLLYFEAGRFEPSGFLHVACAHPFCECSVPLTHLRHFSPDLPEADWEEVETLLSSSQPT